MDIQLLLGIDVGGTRLKAARVAADGRVLDRRSRPTGAAGGPAAVIELVAALCSELMVPGMDRAGVGFAGPVDPAAGIVRHSPNLPGWTDYPLRDELARRLGLPVTLVNDATACAYGEARCGAGRGAGSLVCLTLGTGVGGGIVFDGRPWQGAGGGAGEYGHVCVDPAGPPCGCGARGCLETFCSARAIGDVEALAAAARAGDVAARAVFERAGSALGLVLGQIANTLAPERIVIGGGVAGAWDLLEPTARAGLERHSFAHNRAGLLLVRGELGDDAGPIGAALLAAC